MNIFTKKIKPIIIGVCGRSCSGKSVVTREIEKKYFDDILRIPCDRFFMIFNEKELDRTDGWESPNSIRWDRLIYSLDKLKKGENTHIPSKGWTEIFDQLVKPKKIILLEGYLLFTQKKILDLCDLKIWVDVSDLNILYRRTKRDGTSAHMDYTMNKVIPISKRYEDLQRTQSDVIIDGNRTKDEIIKEVDEYIKGFENEQKKKRNSNS
jgi:uridine kinase